MENTIAKNKGMSNKSYTTRTVGSDGVSMAITSHLSDVEAYTDNDYVNTRCEFVKFLVHKYMVDIKDVNMDKEFQLFLKK